VDYRWIPGGVLFIARSRAFASIAENLGDKDILSVSTTHVRNRSDFQYYIPHSTCSSENTYINFQQTFQIPYT
jgi:hypothetical protein